MIPCILLLLCVLRFSPMLLFFNANCIVLHRSFEVFQASEFYSQLQPIVRLSGCFFTDTNPVKIVNYITNRFVFHYHSCCPSVMSYPIFYFCFECMSFSLLLFFLPSVSSLHLVCTSANVASCWTGS